MWFNDYKNTSMLKYVQHKWKKYYHDERIRRLK